MDSKRLLDRFLQYVRIDTTAVEDAPTYPSSQGQLQLGRLAVAHLTEIGAADVRMDEYGIVWATLPATTDRPVPTIAWCAHQDTSPETTGANVQPQIVENYNGSDLALPGDPTKVITVEENPALRDLVGKTIITTDGTTLLGADDKAGIAEIIEAAAYLIEHPEIPHGEIRICLSCDEEIGQGTKHLTPEQFQAVCCYTVDGCGEESINTATFSADAAVVTVRGVNIHPAVAKDRMVNAVRAAAHFVDQLPRDTLSPESTDGQDGFLHPYEITGGVAQARVRIILRDFDTAKLRDYADLLEQIGETTAAAFPGVEIDIAIKKQYRNMADGLEKEPRAIAYAEEALCRLGRTAERTSIRGGTDGSRLTEMGLPSPNLTYGAFNPHSPLEWACLERMVGSAQWLVELAKVWAEKEEGARG